MDQEFKLVKDPRVKTSNRDLKAQFDLMLAIQAKLNEVVVGVNTSRSLKKRIADWEGRLKANESATEVMAAAQTLSAKLDAVEAELVQKELTSSGDELNYREMLFEKLSGLPPVVRNADAKPTQQSHEVFAKLAGQADEQLTALQTLLDSDLAELNQQLVALDVEIIGV